jgi:hypothetical protein
VDQWRVHLWKLQLEIIVVKFEDFASWLHLGSFIIECDCALIQTCTTAELGNIETLVIDEIYKLSKSISSSLNQISRKMEKKRGYELV